MAIYLCQIFNNVEFTAGELLPIPAPDKQRVLYIIRQSQPDVFNPGRQSVYPLRMPHRNMLPFNYHHNDIFSLSSSISIQALSTVKAISFHEKVFKTYFFRIRILHLYGTKADEINLKLDRKRKQKNRRDKIEL